MGVVMQPDATVRVDANAAPPADPSASAAPVVTPPELEDIDAVFHRAMATFASMAEAWKKGLDDILVERR